MRQACTREIEDILTYPWLGRMISNVPNPNACFLPHLTSDGILKRLPRFNETSECRVEFSRVLPLEKPSDEHCKTCGKNTNSRLDQEGLYLLSRQ
jgi:hypothetical protein